MITLTAMDIPRYPELFEFVAIEWIINDHVDESTRIVAVKNWDFRVLHHANSYFIVPWVRVTRRFGKEYYGAFTWHYTECDEISARKNPVIIEIKLWCGAVCIFSFCNKWKANDKNGIVEIKM